MATATGARLVHTYFGRPPTYLPTYLYLLVRRELSVYVLGEDLFPVRTPRLYFGDISRRSTAYVLVTEAINYGGIDSTSGLAILPKTGE